MSSTSSCHENTNGFSFVFNSSGSCVDWLESDGEAEAFQALNVSVNASAGMSGIVVSLAEVAKRRASREHVVDGDGELVSHGECSTTAASAGLDAMVGSLEEGAAASRAGGGSVAQGGGEVGIAPTRTDRLGFAGALVVARTHANPGGEVMNRGEGGQIDADFSDDDGGDHPVDAGDGDQQRDIVLIRRQVLADLPIDSGDIGLGRLDPSELHGEHLPAMHVEFDREGIDQLVQLLAQLAAGELGHFGRTVPAEDEGAQDGPSRDAKDIAHDARKLDIGGFQKLDQTAPFACL